MGLALRVLGLDARVTPGLALRVLGLAARVTPGLALRVGVGLELGPPHEGGGLLLTLAK